MNKTKIAILASGTGSNAINLIRFFKDDDAIEVAFVLSNKKEAPVLKSADQLGTKTVCFTNQELSNGDFLTEICKAHKIDWVILAGYLRLIPSTFIQVYKNKIINLHPSLLPKYGGKGMHGQHVHKAVVENQEKETGITIHYVNEAFDEGRIIAQFHCAIEPKDGVSEVAAKIHVLEQSYLPIVVQQTILNQ